MSDFHVVVIFNDYYTLIIAFFDQTNAEQKQKQTCCKPHLNIFHNTVNTRIDRKPKPILIKWVQYPMGISVSLGIV